VKRNAGLLGTVALVAALAPLPCLWAPRTGSALPAGEGAAAANTTAGTWRFAVSGDSRNCGDIVMPVIAASVRANGAAFYWHLGDFRKIYDFDEDMQHAPEHTAAPMTIIQYESSAWQDVIDNQLGPFGSLPVFLGIGNHETIPPKTRLEYVAAFADWIHSPPVARQQLADDPHDHQARAYFHWREQGVDFINLDNATPDQFDSTEMSWFERVLERDKADASLPTIVVGMHEALPDSLAFDHSMSESPAGVESGRRVYADLLRAQNEARKHVYVLASHSHYFMDGIFNTPYWREHGGVLPGWIVGTAGAVRYALPEHADQARHAQTKVYGYLLATVNPPGESAGAIRFEFVPLQEQDVPKETLSRFKPDFVHWCFSENADPGAK